MIIKFPRLSALEFLAWSLKCCGAPVTSNETVAAGKSYWRLRFRHLGRLRSVYIGTDNLLVDQVRYELDLLQDQHRHDQELARAVRQSKKKLRVLKARVASGLAGIGLYYHGDQLRKRRVRAAAESAT